jgi:uncharacterized membrane protein
MLDPVFHYLSVVVLALVFLQGAAEKLLAPDEFQGVVANYRLLPGALTAPFARLLPLLELATGIGIIVGASRIAAAWLAVGLLTLFCVAIAINLARGRTEIDCGCFKSALRQTISPWLIARNLLLAAAALALLLPIAPRTVGTLDYLSILAGSLMLFLTYYAAGMLTRRPITRFDAGFERAAPAPKPGGKTL